MTQILLMGKQGWPVPATTLKFGRTATSVNPTGVGFKLKHWSCWGYEDNPAAGVTCLMSCQMLLNLYADQGGTVEVGHMQLPIVGFTPQIAGANTGWTTGIYIWNFSQATNEFTYVNGMIQAPGGFPPYWTVSADCYWFNNFTAGTNAYCEFSVMYEPDM